MISYDRLWKTMEEKKITQYRLIKHYGFSAGQIGRLKKNMFVSTHTIDTLCTILGCGVSDVMEYIPASSDSQESPAADSQAPVLSDSPSVEAVFSDSQAPAEEAAAVQEPKAKKTKKADKPAKDKKAKKGEKAPKEKKEKSGKKAKGGKKK